MSPRRIRMRPSKTWGWLDRLTERTLASTLGMIGPGRSNWGVWSDLLALGREGEMKWRVMVELGGAEGALELREVSVPARWARRPFRRAA
jgi:hypothetical protein